jgi:tetratricopeptide (TPR) repeat protein
VSFLSRFAAAMALALSIASCSSGYSRFLAGTPDQEKKLKSLFTVLEEYSPEGSHPDLIAHFAAARKIAATLIDAGEHGKAAAFLVNLSSASDIYTPWYLFTAAASYEAAGDLPLAIPLYERIVKSLPDLVVEGRSIHQESLLRLVGSVEAPERRIEYFRDLITRFPDSSDIGAFHFLLAKEYEKIGSWTEAMKSYSAFLPYFGTDVPGYPDALAYARQLVEFNASPKDWTYENLDELLAAVRKALISGSARQLRRLASKAGFFAISWYQDSELDANSKVAFDLDQFMLGRPIAAAPALHPSSGAYEAYLRTWGWTGRVPVWYLYFRKIDFPADPAVHGHWEWAGIYFGEKMK